MAAVQGDRIKIKKKSSKKNKKCKICNNYRLLFTPKTESGACTHSLCKYCWSKITACGNGLCPYCREDITSWTFKEFKIKKYIDHEDTKCCDKLDYSYIFSAETYLANIIIYDAETKVKESYFFSPNDPKIIKSQSGKRIVIDDRKDIENALFSDTKMRRINETYYIINERFSNLSFEKFKLLSGMRSFKKGNGMLQCICSKNIIEDDYEEHLKTDALHKEVIETLVDYKYELFCEWFTGVNLDPL